MKAHYQPAVQKRSTGKHASPWHREVAESGTILRTEVGSGLHGTSISGYDDRDEMGVCIEPPDAVIGYKSFEQYQWYTAWEREGGRANRSGAGDLDLTIYSLRKWMKLAMNGNPTVLLMLFAPQDKIVKMTAEGAELRSEMPQHILSRLAGERFAGYLKTQRENMLSHDGKGRDCTRPELVERYGFDTKFAGHMIRLGVQGCELLSTGRITLPMPPAERQLVTDIRNGAHTMKFCLDLAADLESQIRVLTEHSVLPEEPSWEVIDQWLVEVYQWWWVKQGIELGHRR